MSNMGYCRFENTLPDLRDCHTHWDEADSEEEIAAQKRLLSLCVTIVKDFGGDALSNALYRAQAKKEDA